MVTTAESNLALAQLSDVEVTTDFASFVNRDDFTTSLEAFFNIALREDDLADHIALITRYPPRFFNINDDSPVLTDLKPKLLYFRASQILLVEVTSNAHEVAAANFGMYIGLKIYKMGCDEEITPCGKATMTIGNVQKSPDGSWGPLRHVYTTLAVEVAVSESSKALRRDAAFWLERKESKVTQVVTIKISRKLGITLNLWTSLERVTRANHQPRAVVEQKVHITLQAGRPVVKGKLSISFEKLFERKPRPGTGEGDLKFSDHELERLASLVWRMMDVYTDKDSQ